MTTDEMWCFFNQAIKLRRSEYTAVHDIKCSLIIRQVHSALVVLMTQVHATTDGVVQVTTCIGSVDTYVRECKTAVAETQREGAPGALMRNCSTPWMVIMT
jgi:hypothetical protein